MDNPHYITPEEAEDLYCPISMGAIEGKDLCAGPKCMAWRWGPSYKWNEDEDRPEVTYSTTHGYCGMAKS